VRSRATAATRSEAFQQVTGRKECVCLLECEVAITRDYFRRICNSRNYVKCHHLAKRMGELMIPMAWLQRQAIREESVENGAPENAPNPGSASENRPQSL